MLRFQKDIRMRDSIINSGIVEGVKKPSDVKAKKGSKEVKKKVPTKKKARVYTVNKSNMVEDQDRISRLALSLGMSYSEARQYVQKSRTSYSSRSKKKPLVEVTVIDGDTGRKISGGNTGKAKKSKKDNSLRLSLKEYSVFCLVNDDKKLEGVIIALPDKLHEGFFFVSDKSALCFISTCAKDISAIQNEILATRKKLKIANNGDCTVQYVTGKMEYPSVAQRRMLCHYISDAIKQNVEDIPTEALIKHLFRKEKRVSSSEVSVFVSKGLYLPENASLVPVYKEENDVPRVIEASSEPIEEIPMENCFYDGGVLMEGTRESAKLVHFPSNKSMKEYFVPEYVTAICTGAFANTNRLEAVKLGDNVKTIEKEAFVNNTSLASITIPKNVEVVEDGAFTRCHNLLIAFVSSKSPGVSCRLFVDCPRLESLATLNERLRNSMDIIRESSNSKVELRVHKTDKVAEYPFLSHNDKIVVMGNIYNCLTQRHKINTMWVNVPIKENGKYKAAPICVFMCKKCKRKFILPDVYEYYLMRYDFVNTKIFVPIQYSNWYTGYQMGLTDISGLQPKGVLKEIGYSVSESEGLSSTSRINILKSVIEFGILTKAEVEQYLEFFINYIGAQDRMISACLKWQSDLNAIHNMHFNKVKYSDG